MKVSAEPRGRTFTLTLTEGEAGVLLKLVGRVTGSPSASPRGFCSDLFDELTALHVRAVGELNEPSSFGFRDGPRTSELAL